MLKKDADGNIEITRGNILPLKVSTKDAKTGEPYTFKIGDIVKFSITEKKDCGAVVLEKRVEVLEESTTVPIVVTADEMKIGELISKPEVYWYEVELNPDTPETQTIIGYTTAAGPKTITLTPESGDKK